MTCPLSAVLRPRGTLDHSRIHPRMLKSNSTSHKWAFGALAELIDNAQDEDAGAKNISITGTDAVPGGVLTVEDDGKGMTRDSLHNMLSFGESEKEAHTWSVGRFGVGFKSGSMRLASDALIFTRQAATASVGLMSQTFLAAVDAQEIFVPMLTWTVQHHGTLQAAEPSDPRDWAEALSVVTQYSHYKDEQQLQRQLQDLPRTGTRIVLYNLRKEEGVTELDLSGCPGDIRIRGPQGQAYRQDREDQQTSESYDEDSSLRAYLSILYLKPRATFVLQGKRVEPRNPIAALIIQQKSYGPRRFRDPHDSSKARLPAVKLWLGYNSAPEYKRKHGMHIYNKNRLIKMYAKFGDQRQYNCMMKDMLGVVEADCLVPTHNKQDFQTSGHIYHKFSEYVRKCMKDYYYDFQTYHTAGKGAGRRPHSGKRQAAEDSEDDDGTAGDAEDSKEAVALQVQRSMSLNETDAPGQLRRQASVGVRAAMARQLAVDDPEELPSAGSHKRNRKQATTAGAESCTEVDWRTMCCAALDKLHRLKGAAIFFKPVTVLEAPNYFEVIDRPMDFGTIRHRLLGTGVAAGGRYDRLSQFRADCELVFSNAYTFNCVGDDVWKLAKKLEEAFQKAWDNLEAQLPHMAQPASSQSTDSHDTPSRGAVRVLPTPPAQQSHGACGGDAAALQTQHVQVQHRPSTSQTVPAKKTTSSSPVTGKRPWNTDGERLTSTSHRPAAGVLRPCDASATMNRGSPATKHRPVPPASEGCADLPAQHSQRAIDNAGAAKEPSAPHQATPAVLRSELETVDVASRSGSARHRDGSNAVEPPRKKQMRALNSIQSATVGVHDFLVDSLACSPCSPIALPTTLSLQSSDSTTIRAVLQPLQMEMPETPLKPSELSRPKRARLTPAVAAPQSQQPDVNAGATQLQQPGVSAAAVPPVNAMATDQRLLQHAAATSLHQQRHIPAAEANASQELPGSGTAVAHQRSAHGNGSVITATAGYPTECEVPCSTLQGPGSSNPWSFVEAGLPWITSGLAQPPGPQPQPGQSISHRGNDQHDALAQAQCKQDDLHAALADAQHERDALRAALADTRQEQDALQAALAEARQEQDALQAALAEARQERDVLQAALAEARQERDPLQAALAQARQELDVIRASSASAQQERNELRAALAESRLERDAEAAAAEHLQEQHMSRIEMLQQENLALRVQAQKDQAKMAELSAEAARLKFLVGRLAPRSGDQ